MRLGSSVRSIPSQYGGFHFSQRTQLAQFADDPSARSAHVGTVNVRPEPGESPADGSADPHAPRLQGVRLQSWRRIPEVISRSADCISVSQSFFSSLVNTPPPHSFHLYFFPLKERRKTCTEPIIIS